MRVAIAGSHGLIGTALAARLRAQGHEAVPIVRGTSSEGVIGWDPTGDRIDVDPLAHTDAVVNLAGEPIGVGRWTDAKKERIRDSRVRGTALLARTLASIAGRPRVFVNASAIGFYGDRGAEPLSEDSGPGTGYLADLVQEWEAATVPAVDGGVRVVLLRNGLVLSPGGGALGKILPLFKLGLGGKLGSGRQWWSWIAIDDTVGMILHALTHDRVAGPLNATAPQPVTNRDFTRELAAVLGRPALLPAPAFGVKLVMGAERSEEMLFASQRVLPTKALADGYRFDHPELGQALRSLLGRP